MSTNFFTAPEDRAVSRRAVRTGFRPTVGCPMTLRKRRSCSTLMPVGVTFGISNAPVQAHINITSKGIVHKGNI